MKKSGIYTKTGDTGSTGLIGGTRVQKNHARLEAYGTIDELNSHLGMIRSYPLDVDDLEMILFIQNKLFSVGGNLATDKDVVETKPNTTIKNEDILRLENGIDKIDETLEPLSYFILPGGDPQVSATHIARTVCRRAERLIVSVSGEFQIDEEIIVFINRLSDYLFVLARKLQKKSNSSEIPWLPS